MKNRIRTILAVLAGLAVSFVVIQSIEYYNSIKYPFAGDLHTADALQKHISTLPFMAFLNVLLGYMTGTLVGSYVAARIAKEPFKMRASMIVGFILLLAGIVLFISIPHPIWLAISSCISYIAMSYIGYKLATF